MRKQTPIHALPAIAVLLLFILPACNAVPDGFDQKYGLSGKIKSSRMIGIQSDTMDLEFHYDSLYRVDRIKVNGGDPFTFDLYITYETNKVTIMSDTFPSTGDIFYLKPGTNLIDSIDLYYNYSFAYRLQLTRNASDAIVHIRHGPPANPANNILLIDSSTYIPGQLNFIYNQFDLFWRSNPHQYSILSRSTPARSNLDPLGIEHLTSITGLYFHLTADVFGLRFQHTPPSIIDTYEYVQYKYPNTHEIISCSYPIYNDTLVIMQMESNILDDRILINTYYP